MILLNFRHCSLMGLLFNKRFFFISRADYVRFSEALFIDWLNQKMELRMKRYVHPLHFDEEKLRSSFIFDNMKLIWNNKITTQTYESAGIVVKHKGIPSSWCWCVQWATAWAWWDLFERKTICRKATQRVQTKERAIILLQTGIFSLVVKFAFFLSSNNTRGY